MAENPLDNSQPPPPPPPGEKKQEVGVPVDVEVLPKSDNGGLVQYPMTDAIRAMAETGAIRNQGTAILLRVMSQLREIDLKAALEERQAAQKDADKFKDECFQERTKNAVLGERLRAGLQLKKLQNILITLGGIMCGAGLQPLVNSFSTSYFVIAMVGLILLFVGWFYSGDSKENQR